MDFQAHLDTHFAQYDEVQVGDVHILPVTQLVRDKLAGGGVSVQRIRRVAGEVLATYLGHADTYMIDGAGRATVLMPGVSHAHAERRLAGITNAILERLRNEVHGPDPVEVRTTLTTRHRDRTGRDGEGERARDARAPAWRPAAAPAAGDDAPSAVPEAAPLRTVIGREGCHHWSKPLDVAADPIWRPDVDHIVGHASRPVLVRAGGTGQRVSADALRALNDRQRIKADSVILARTMDRIVAAKANVAAGLHMAPIALASLEREPYRDRIIALLDELSPAERHLLVCEIVDIPEPPPVKRLAEACARVNTRCRGVWCRVPLRRADLSWLKTVKAQGVGADLADLDHPEHRVLKGLDAFAEAAGRAGVSSYVTSIPSRALTTAAVAAGYAYVGSRVLDADIGRETGIAAYSVARLFATAGTMDVAHGR